MVTEFCRFKVAKLTVSTVLGVEDRVETVGFSGKENSRRENFAGVMGHSFLEHSPIFRDIHIYIIYIYILSVPSDLY